MISSKEIVGVFLAVALSLTGFAKRDDPFIFLNEDEVLQVRFYYNGDPELRFSAPSVADEMERMAQDEFREALAAVLEGASLPVAVEVLEPLADVEKSLPVLTVQALRWKTDGFGSLEAVIRVELEGEGYKNRLGTFRESDVALVVTSQDRMREARVKVMTEALAKMVYELNSHFKLPGEE